SCDPVGTPIEIKDKLDLDQNGTPVDAAKYHSMIGALMYLMSSRPDVVHATCLCARYQAKPTEKHLKEVKKIFRYLRGTVNTGLWYTKYSGFELTRFSNANYAGCKDTFKSTFAGAQFLGKNLMVNTRQSTPEFSSLAFDEAVQRAVDALLPNLTTQITNELRQNGWLAISLRVMLLIGGKLSSKPREVKRRWGHYHGRTSMGPSFCNSSRGLHSRSFVGKKLGPPKEQAKHFKWALSDWILDGIVNTEFTDVAQVANAGRNIELLRERGGVNNKRNHDRDRIQSANKNNNQRGYGQRGNYGRNYDRQGGKECYRVTSACFIYGLTGHIAKDCPKNSRGNGNNKRPDVKGKVYSLTRDQAANSSGNVTGTLFMNGRVVFVLLDTGATYSVISVSLSKYINVPPTLLNYTLSISTPMRSLVVIDREHQNCPLQFDDKIRSANLFPLDIDPSNCSDFSDVFPEELLGIPPERKVKFGIELILDLMNHILHEYLDKFVIVFIDDILVYSKTKEEHERHLRQVVLLGHIVSADGITMDPVKVEAITKWPRLKTVTKKSFEELKKRLVFAPILTLPSGSGGFHIYSDASKKGLGCVLMQHGKVIAYASRQLKPYKKFEEDEQTKFRVDDDGVMWFGYRLCVPSDPTLREAVLSEAHSSPFSIHPGRCLICQQVKIEHQRASGLLQPLDIPVWKWDEISMDFMMGLPRTQKKNDAIWVVVDRLTKSAHFLPIPIISERDPRFTSHFWKGLQSALGIRLKFSTAFHPEIDGQTERTIQTLEDMLSWHASIKAAPYELLYERKCRALIYWNEVGERVIEGSELIEVTNKKVVVAKKKLKEARGVPRFGIKGKLSPRFIGPFEISDLTKFPVD
nr:hypothetical protein [Tanacetum cinerariifolium]